MVLLAQDSMWEDEWGVGRRHVTGGLGAAVVSHPIQEWCELDDYLQTRLPDVNEPGRFDAAQASVQEFGGKYLLGKMFACFFERMHFLRGMEQLLMDLYLNRREVIKLADRLLDFSLGMIRRWAQMGVDGVFLSDDWGTQDRLLVSPTLWRTVFGSYYRRMIEEAHHLGLQVFLHSCGNITEIVPDLVDMGLDVLHPIQPWAMDIERIAREFGRYITLFGGIDVQRLLTKSTPGEVKSEIRNLVEIVHKHHGTIILAPTNSIVPETPLENIEAMFQTYREIGIGGKGWF
ncbi:MAG: hypothetical protein HPY71_15520 [Firmicutes bacterium]|nr:hypothetical protein [Bacillota bacterium]